MQYPHKKGAGGGGGSPYNESSPGRNSEGVGGARSHSVNPSAKHFDSLNRAEGAHAPASGVGNSPAAHK